MSPLIKNIVLALGLAVIAYVGYLVFLKNDSDEVLTASNSVIQSQAARDAQEFLSRLQQLRSIELDDELFNDPRFQSLIDQRRDLFDEPVGRANPFAPVVAP